MFVYRIASHKYAKDISGTGAALYGGRWNKKGTPVLYTGGNIETALLEILVHLPAMFTPKLDVLTLEIPENSITKIKKELLPKGWNEYPAPSVLAEIGQDWIDDEKTIALNVPSCIVNSASLYILNCLHPDYNKKVKIVEQKPFPFDKRLKK